MKRSARRSTTMCSNALWRDGARADANDLISLISALLLPWWAWAVGAGDSPYGRAGGSHQSIGQLPAAAFGSRVFVCSNLAFIGDHVIKRKHTANSKRDLPGLVSEVIEHLQQQ